MFHVRGMSAPFLCDQVNEVFLMPQNAGGRPVSIICDGNRVDQKFFKMFETMTKKPWLTTCFTQSLDSGGAVVKDEVCRGSL